MSACDFQHASTSPTRSRRRGSLTGWTLLALLCLLAPAGAGAQVLFDFDTAPLGASLPIDVTELGITAHLSATGQGFSIQHANALGFTPLGFSGLCIYPNSIYQADLLISFSVPLTDFSIMYAPEEYGCDSSATMLVTGYMDGVSRGSAAATAPFPGTWPVGVLSYSNLSGFNSVVVHYFRSPPCGDIGPIFMADNMTVTQMTTDVPIGGPREPSWVIAPNPFRGATAVRLRLERGEPITVTVHDPAGRLVRTLARGETFEPGTRVLVWDGRNDAGDLLGSGVYFCRVRSESGAHSTPVILRR